MKIAKNTVVTVAVLVTDADNNPIDESGEPMVYLHGGYDGTFPKIEEALDSQEVGYETNIQLEPADAFGDYDAELVKIEARARFPEPLEIGMQFEGVPDDGTEEEAEIFTVTDIAEDRVVLDGNHPLAGIALRFSLKVVDVRAATADEVEHGHAHGTSGLEVHEEDEEETEDDAGTPPAPTLH